MKQLITILAFLQTLISFGQEANVNNEIKKDFKNSKIPVMTAGEYLIKQTTSNNS